MGIINTHYSDTGFAEFVHNPTDITYEYLKEWFSGASSLGLSMSLLGLPYSPLKEPVVEHVENALVVNLDTQYKTLYEDTTFKYSGVRDGSDQKMVFDITKAFIPTKVLNTFKIISVQAGWISKPVETLEFCKKLYEETPWVSESDISQIEEILKLDIWPKVFALAHISEFYNQLIQNEAQSDFPQIQNYISKKQLEHDWYAHSIYDQKLVNDGKMSFETFIKEYGIRADKDYELTCPRWYEIPDIILQRIESYSSVDRTPIADTQVYEQSSEKLKTLINTEIELQIIRSQVKRKALNAINILRQKLLSESKLTPTPTPTPTPTNVLKEKKSITPDASPINPGRGVSMGTVLGTVHHIKSAADEIPDGTIGVFPNASPEFSFQYPKCNGMIFLTGGTTSHGAIVAREFGIPAIINDSAVSLEEGIHVRINGETGDFSLIN
jgi:phosphohistidine swiveling domain-containing protein